MKWPWEKAAGKQQLEDATGQLPADAPGTVAAANNVSAKSTGAGVAEHSLVESLTLRERDVFDLLMQGLKLQEVADELGIKFSTVNTHQKNIYKKLGVNSRAECIIRYGKYGKER